MPDIILTTLNARYSHASLGLRYLYANLGELQARAVIREFTIALRPLDIAEQLLVENPKIIGLGVYIWNITEATALVSLLKQLAAHVTVILSSPYPYYTDEDLRTHFIYVEASRGCPFKCEFCLSALDKTAYPFELKRFLEDMETLWQRGLRQFRFVERTFNLKIQTTIAILDFF